VAPHFRGVPRLEDHLASAGEPDRRPSRQPFQELPNVLMTPHSSSSSEATAERRRSAVAGNLDRFARREPVENFVLRT